MKRIAFAGTFDPVTTGHLWVINEAINLADEVVVFIAENQSKSPLFSSTERFDIFNAAVKEHGWEDRVTVNILKNAYVARAAKAMDCDYLIRGIRSTVDFDYENLLQQTNTDVLHGAKTVFVMSPQNLGAVSSSYVKSLIGPPGWHWYVSNFLPKSAYRKLLEKRLYWYWTSFVKDASHQLNGFNGVLKQYALDRVYHNEDHLMHILDELYAHPDFDRLSVDEKSALIRSAFVHDLVQGKNNELDLSIELFNNTVDPKYKLNNLEIELVQSTSHKMEIPSSNLMKMLISADLSILGQDPTRYNIYTCAVKEEYLKMHKILAKTPFLYSEGRKKVMSTFLERCLNGTLYPDGYFSKLYTQNAKRNIERELASYSDD